MLSCQARNNGFLQNVYYVSTRIWKALSRIKNKNYQEKIRLQTQERVVKIDAPIAEDAPIATLFVDGAQIETSNENPFFLSS